MRNTGGAVVQLCNCATARKSNTVHYTGSPLHVSVTYYLLFVLEYGKSIPFLLPFLLSSRYSFSTASVRTLSSFFASLGSQTGSTITHLESIGKKKKKIAVRRTDNVKSS